MGAIYQSVLRRKRTQEFVFADLGARWGTWGARAVAFLRTLDPQHAKNGGYSLYFVDCHLGHADGLRRVMQKNNIDRYKLDVAFADSGKFRRWAANQSHIDVVN